MEKQKITTTPLWYQPPANSRIVSVGPEISPYTSPVCKIYFEAGVPFTVPRDFIRASVELDKICNKFDEIRLSKVPDDAGHVLVHYLHTGDWQTLHKKDSLHGSKISTQFEISVHAYALARAFGLTGLAELGKENMSRLAAALPALDSIIHAADACELLPDDDLWFSAFIKMRIQQLFKDPANLNQSVLLRCFRGSTVYSTILAKSLVRIFCENSVSLRSAESRVHSPPEASAPLEPDATLSTNSPKLTPDLAEPATDATFESEAVLLEQQTEVAVEVPVETEAVAFMDFVPEPESEPIADDIPEAPEPEPETVAELGGGPKPPKKSKKKEKKSKKVKAPEVTCADKAAHIVEGGWEDCSSCRESVGILSSSYQSKENDVGW